MVFTNKNHHLKLFPIAHNVYCAWRAYLILIFRTRTTRNAMKINPLDRVNRLFISGKNKNIHRTIFTCLFGRSVSNTQSWNCLRWNTYSSFETLSCFFNWKNLSFVCSYVAEQTPFVCNQKCDWMFNFGWRMKFCFFFCLKKW